MLEKGKISSAQAVLLMISLILPTAVLTVPSITVIQAGQDAIFSIVIAALAGLAIAALIVYLGLRFPGKTIYEYTEEILGTVPGKILGFLYIWWFLHTNALIIREFSGFLVSAVMPETPNLVFAILVVAVAAYAVYNGLEVLARANQLLILTTVMLAMVFILSIPLMRISRMLPLFDNGMIGILKGSAVPISWLGEILTFSMIIPYLKKPKQAYKIAGLSILSVCFFLLMVILEVLLIFGPSVSTSWSYPTFNAIRLIAIAHSLERMEVIIVLAWVLGGFFKVGIFYYAAVLGSAQWLKLSDYRPIVLPIGVILVALSALIHANTIELHDFLSRFWPPYAITIEVGIPLVLLFIAMARKKGGRKTV